MHVGAMLIFEGPPPSYDDFLEHVRSRLHLVPRFRQKLAFPPFETGRPFWVDDPNFNLAYHVRHSALPAPGSEEQLRNIAGRLFSQRLDRSKPLWELWLVQGLERNRFALITKTHHALVDGVSGRRHRHRPLRPQAGAGADRARPRLGARSLRPRPRELAARGLVELGEAPFKLGRRAFCARPAIPMRTAAGCAEAGEALGEVAWNFTNPAPEVPLNTEIGSHRRFAWTRAELARLQGDQGRARRHRQRRRPRRRQRRAAELAAQPRHQDRGPRAAGAGARLDPRRGRARPARQPDRGDARRRCRSTSRTR